MLYLSSKTDKQRDNTRVAVLSRVSRSLLRDLGVVSTWILFVLGLRSHQKRHARRHQKAISSAINYYYFIVGHASYNCNRCSLQTAVSSALTLVLVLGITSGSCSSAVSQGHELNFKKFHFFHFHCIFQLRLWCRSAA